MVRRIHISVWQPHILMILQRFVINREVDINCLFAMGSVAVKSAVPVLEDLSAPQVSSDVEPEAEVLTGPQEPEGRWEDLPEAGVSDIEPELKKLSKVFHGSKITKVSKKTVQGKSE